MPRKKRETRETAPLETSTDPVAPLVHGFGSATADSDHDVPNKRGRPRKDRTGERERLRARREQRDADTPTATDDAPIAWRKWAAVGACVVFVLALLAWMRSVSRLHAVTFDALDAIDKRLKELDQRPARVIVREIRSNGEIRETGPLPPPPSPDGAAS